MKTPQYERCFEQLESTKKPDLLEKIEILKDVPFEIAKKLQGTLDGKYSVRFANDDYRLIVVINVNSKKVQLGNLAPRSLVYDKNKLW